MSPSSNTRTKIDCRWLEILALSLLALSPWTFAQVPTVRKVEPPNWWTNYTPELTLLLTGENLQGTTVTTSGKQLQIVGSEPSSNGHYLFLHLKTAPSLEPTTAHLQLSTPHGSTVVDLPFLKRADPRGHFHGFSRDDIIYLIMPDRFADGDPSNNQPPGSTGVYDRSKPMAWHGGDLRGIRQHLNYLHDLGVTTLWLTPVWKNTDSDYHGYHVVDFYALDDHMGTLAEYQELVSNAHKLGMKVLMDFVANHTGPKDAWASDPPTPTWLHGTPQHHLDPSYSFLGLVDPHASPRQYRATIEGWFAGKLPDLNPDDPQLALFLAQNAMWWAETAQLDGFRIDTYPYSSRQFWSGWQERLSNVYRHLNAVGEVADPDPSITSFFQGGRRQLDGIDTHLATVFDFPMRNALRDVVIKEQPISKIIDVLRHDELYPHPETLVTFLGNHDDKRFVGEDGSSLAKLKGAFSLLLTMRGIPQIYSGDEIGMTGGDDPDNRCDFPGGFPGDPHDAFTKEGRSPEQQDVFAYVQSLLALRKAHPALRTGKHWHIAWDDTYYAFLRDVPEEKLLVVYNNSADARELKIPLSDTPAQDARQLESIFGNIPGEIAAGEAHLTLGPRSLAVYRLR
jgi:glycosidase